MNLIHDVIYNLLCESPNGLTRGELAKLTGMKRTTLYNYLIKLWLKNRVTKYPKNNKGTQGNSLVKWFALG